MKTAEKFLWGVAISAYQAEGGYNGKDEPQTNWASAEERGDVAVVGRSSEFWTRYREDFECCQKLGLNAFRMGIEWSRVQPIHINAKGDSPPFDEEALRHYARIFAACRQHGMEPVVTLHHFVHPAWLGADPWLDAETPHLFALYVRESVSRINRLLVDEYGQEPLRFFITINEPNMLVLNTYIGNQFPSEKRLGMRFGLLAYNHLLTAHVHAYNVIHDLYELEGWASPQVTFNNYCSDLYWSDKVLLDLVSVREREISRANVKDHIYEKKEQFEAAYTAAKISLHRDLPYYFGALVKKFSDWMGYRWFDAEHFKTLLDALYESPRARVFDYVGLDYYDPFTAHAFRFPVFWDHEFKNKSVRTWVMNTITSKWWDWRVLPRGLHFFCNYYANDFGRPILIAENGMALRQRKDSPLFQRKDNMTRSQFLRLHVHEVIKILKEEIPLFGYLHWSLFDNYEWGSFTPRFGLYSLDYNKGTDRLECAPNGDCPSKSYGELIREAKEALAKPSIPGK